MSTISRPGFFGTSLHGINNIQRPSAPFILRILNSSSSPSTKKENQFSEELHEKVTIPQSDDAVTQPPLQFDRLQSSDQLLIQENRIEFGKFVAREAQLNEEYWTAAWLRAESHWEDRTPDRYAENYKRKFADQEYNALKQRRKAILGQKSTCILAVRKEEENVKCTVLKSVVGTLDLTIGVLSHGQTYPGEQVKFPLFFNNYRKGLIQYGYISNLCVSKSARRQGIASNMLMFAIKSAHVNGVEQVYVHVRRDNKPAQELYKKTGFEVVEEATSALSEEQTYLLRLKA